MKTFGMIIAIFLLPVITMAQGKLKPMDDSPKPKVQATQPRTGETNVYKHSDAPVVQSVGKVYDADDLMNMPRRDVNSVAATVQGVDSRAGTNETPHIRGADQSGTAYYVDGVRIYGAMPIMTK
jgi:outer membrane receptor for ferrienterochelin and colicin